MRALGGKEIREKAAEWSAIRKLTPGELAIAQEFGYRKENENEHEDSGDWDLHNS